VFPEAQIKVFLDAPAAVRAGRRTADLQKRGQHADMHRTATEIAERDGRDRMRSEAPMMQAADATYVDSGEMSADEVVETILKLVRARTSNGKGYPK
jgi:cytidylate kinase